MSETGKEMARLDARAGESERRSGQKTAGLHPRARTAEGKGMAQANEALHESPNESLPERVASLETALAEASASGSWRISASLRASLEAQSWFRRNRQRALVLAAWLKSGRLDLAADAFLSYYRRHPPFRGRSLIPRKLRKSGRREPRLLSIEEWAEQYSRSPSAEILVFQNVYGDGLIERLDPAFVPVEGRRNLRTEIREFNLFLQMFRSGLYRCAALTGIVSPKFTGKARVSGDEFLGFIRQNPGYDAYFVNPFPYNPYYTFNVWYHGELCHPGLAALAETLFVRAGYDGHLIRDPRDSAKTALYSSYWVAGEAFWEGYVAMLVRLFEALLAMAPQEREPYLSPAPNYPDAVPILTFILERSFSAYLHINPALSALAYPFSREAIVRHARLSGQHFEANLVSAFGGVIDEIDARREYTEADRELFHALTRLCAPGVEGRWR